MSRIKLSIESAMKAIEYSNEAKDNIKMNINILDNQVNNHYNGLLDPTIIKYQELSEKMQELLKTVSMKIEDVSIYCEKIIRWIQEYNEY